MATYVLRAWLPDRPGALGAVASRIGAVRGDVIGIDILERDGGRALDEVTVRLPREDLVPLLIEEVSQVDGVEVEDVSLLPGPLADPRLDGLAAAAALVDQDGRQDLLDMLAHQVCRIIGADWAVVVDLNGVLRALAGSGWEDDRWSQLGSAPGPGSATAVSSEGRGGLADDGQLDTARSRLAESGLEVVLGRSGQPLRQRERGWLTRLAGIADRRWSEMEAAQAPVERALDSSTADSRAWGTR